MFKPVLYVQNMVTWLRCMCLWCVCMRLYAHAHTWVLRTAAFPHSHDFHQILVKTQRSWSCVFNLLILTRDPSVKTFTSNMFLPNYMVWKQRFIKWNSWQSARWKGILKLAIKISCIVTHVRHKNIKGCIIKMYKILGCELILLIQTQKDQMWTRPCDLE